MSSPLTYPTPFYTDAQTAAFNQFVNRLIASEIQYNHFYDQLFKTDKNVHWQVPHLVFNTQYAPILAQDNNQSRVFRKDVIRNIYTRLKEKWLYKDPIFRNLLKYFKVTVNDQNRGRVSFIKDPAQPTPVGTNDPYDKQIFRFIEKYLVTRHFISDVIKRYMKKAHIQWTDLLYHTQDLKRIIAEELEYLIVVSIYEAQALEKKH